MKPTSSTVEYGLRLERRLSPTIKSILGNQFIVQDPSEDKSGGTDFIVWNILPIRVAVRLRTYPFFLRYPDEFTIRWKLPSGIETEIHKIRKGAVDYLLYGFVDREEAHIISYFIGDLSLFRQLNLKPIDIRWNNPPDSQLAIYALKQFPVEFVIKRFSGASV